MVNGTKEYRRSSRTAYGTRAGELHTTVFLDARVALGNLYRKARIVIFTSSRAVGSIVESGKTKTCNSETHIVVQELSPLHQHMCVLSIISDVGR